MFQNKKNNIVTILAFLLILFVFVINKNGGENKEDFSIECNNSSPCIAIVIDDFGYINDHIVEGFLSINEKMTFAVIPGHLYSRQIAREAYSNGFEILLHMPMESHKDNLEKEPFIISSTMTRIDIEEKIKTAFLEIPEAVGMNNHQGSKFTEIDWAMETLAPILKKNKKYFLDSRTSPNTIAESVIKKYGIKTVHRDVFIDNELSENYVKEKIKELEKIAMETGYAIGIGHAKEITLNVLKKIIPKIKHNGIKFCFVSDILPE